jgi:signal transduction histidine kinase
MSGPDTTALEAAARRIAALEAEVAALTDAARRASQTKDEFLATLSHELRTPLNAMLGWVQLLRMHIGDPEERERALDVLERNIRAQVQIVTDLLDVSRVITGRMRVACRRVNLERVVRRGVDALRPAAVAKHVSLDVETQPVHGLVYGDAARLQQVVWNLVSNGVKFTPAGGRVAVVMAPHDGHVAVEVRDTGPGVPPDVLPYIFDRFRQGDSSLTRPFGGLGLGLAIVRHLVELHGGSVRVNSSTSGTTFTVVLPLHAGSDETACKLLSKSSWPGDG